MTKYHAKKVKIDGYTFDSKMEGRRYLELKLLEKAGDIDMLDIHFKYTIEVNGFHVCNYTADFRYWDNTTEKNPIYRVEDVKGVRTPVYKLKKKLMKAIYNIDILETTA